MNSNKTVTINYKAHKRVDIRLIVLTSLILYAFCIYKNAVGDESSAYFLSLKQAQAKWPRLDMSPFWTISSFYLWITVAFHKILHIFFDTDLIISGRIFSLGCWITLLMLASKNLPEKKWKIFIILFNPYLLVFTTRAHPMVPSILLYYLFIITSRSNQNNLAGLLLTLAVNFQVYIGGTTAIYAPDSMKNLNVSQIRERVKYPLFALFGVLITWLTWGGVYPEQFVNDNFYKTFHAYGKPSFGYFASTLLLSGLFLSILGERPLSQCFRKSRYNYAVLGVMSLCTFSLFFTGNIIGTIENASQTLFGDSGKKGWIVAYGICGLGWLRVHRDHLFLLKALFGAAVLLVMLPYFYERITIFAIIAPCLSWILIPVTTDTQTHQNLTIACCIFSVILTIIYEMYGSL
jgi:hypothetical protein